MTLPTDFEVPDKTKKEYVDDTYAFVLENYKGSNKIHHLALLVAIIATDSLLPRLFLPVNSRPSFLHANTKEKVRDIYEELPWCQRNKKGMSDRKTFIGMITSFIIALYEPKSPLRQHMLTGGLGNDWTYKNCKSTFNKPLFPFLVSHPFILAHILSLPAVKGITYSLLIRLNVLWGVGPGACDKGTFGKNWGCHSTKDAHAIYDNLVYLLDSDDPFAPFDTLTFLIGEKNARYFCKTHLGYHYRPSEVEPESASHPASHALSLDIDF
jgi:hypothetical protein